MSKKTRIILGVLFLIMATIANTIIKITADNVTPIQSTESKQAGVLVGLGRGMALTQEITAAKNYITGVSLVFTQNGRDNSNRNTLLVMDTSYNVLHKEVFSSSMLKEGDYDLFKFDEPVFIGQGNKFLLTLFSMDGTESNSAAPLMNKEDSIGRFMTCVYNPDDVIASLKQPQSFFTGSLMLKTYETNQSQLWLVKISLYFLILIITLLIIWSDKISSYLAVKTLKPEYAFLVISLIFSLLFTYITPPFQVPDEGTHFKLSYSVSEFGFLKANKTFPTSIAQMDSAFMHLRFLAGKKIHHDEIKDRFNVKVLPEIRSPLIATDYSLPYLPQAIGISAGKLVSSSLLTQMYFGRIFNLLIAIIIMFFAIRLVPYPFRILFMLLALMPKTIFLFGSLSYDSFTISLSFFAIALFLYYAYVHEKEIGIKDLVYMGGVVLLLLLCKPPYFLIGALFFIIPPRKFGKLYKFIWIGIGIAVVGVFLLKGVPMISNYKAKSQTAQVVSTVDSTGANLPLFQPDVQMQVIFNDIPAYLTMIYKSGFEYFRTYLMKSFVGVLGYIDVEIPDLLTYSYLFLILFVALAISTDKIKVSISNKTLFLILLALSYIVIETAMWLYATRPGRDRVFGVQGRYFIPMAPLLFMLFYNRYISPKLNLLLSLRRKEYNVAKPKAKPVVLDEIQHKERLFDKYLLVTLILYCTFALIYSVYVTMTRYYM